MRFYKKIGSEETQTLSFVYILERSGGMWSLIGFCMFIFACINRNDNAMLAAGLFAIAGSIDVFGIKFNKKKD